MGCCGESRESVEDKQIQSEPTPYFVNQQPIAHPAAVYGNGIGTPLTTPPPQQFHTFNG